MTACYIFTLLFQKLLSSVLFELVAFQSVCTRLILMVISVHITDAMNCTFSTTEEMERWSADLFFRNWHLWHFFSRCIFTQICCSLFLKFWMTVFDWLAIKETFDSFHFFDSFLFPKGNYEQINVTMWHWSVFEGFCFILST